MNKLLSVTLEDLLGEQRPNVLNYDAALPCQEFVGREFAPWKSKQ